MNTAPVNRHTQFRVGRSLLKSKEWTVRQASRADEASLWRLIKGSKRAALRFGDKDLGNRLTAEPFLLGEREGRLRGFLGCSARRYPHAAIAAAGLEDECPILLLLDILLPRCLEHLSARNHASLSYVGSAAWLAESLQERGFRLIDHIVAYETTDFSVPLVGNPRVTIRPVQLADFEALVDLDALDFHPIWRNSHDTFHTWQQTLPYFVVSSLGDRPVGYCTCTLPTPGHGHLIRMAVHPDWQGHGVGSRLMAEAIRYFRQAGTQRVTLNTQEGNRRAQWLYSQFGFRLTGREAVALWKEL